MSAERMRIGRFLDTTPEEVDAKAGRWYLKTFWERNQKSTNPKTKQVLTAVKHYMEDNPIRPSKPLGEVGQRVKVTATLLEAERRSMKVNPENKTIKHVFRDTEGNMVLVYSTTQAIMSVNISDQVTIEGTVKLIKDSHIRGVDGDKVTILNQVDILCA